MADPNGVICLGEALIDRLGPLGGDSACDQPVDDRLGGAPANVACALARLGTAVAFVGRVGGDAIGAEFQRLFVQRGVDSSTLQLDPSRPTRIVLVRRSGDGERQFQGFAGDQGDGFADQALQPVALPSTACWLLVGTIPLASPQSAQALLDAVARARSHGIALALDVNWRPTFWNATADPDAGPTQAARSAIRPLLEQAALIKLAREEALWFFAGDDPGVISSGLPQRPDVVLTDGPAPVRWCIGGESGTQPALSPPQVIDTTGAGDAFTAGLLHRWLAPVTERLRFAAACGALVCAGAGGIDPQPTEAQVEAFLGGVS
ncbi:putative fructokinase [Synechococcus sp. CC9902]|uniref:carbohydrate kinase family protein n=1 Tax=Synechococcus sp. (strain CC9902) TaxID=316279 RepID=UPI00005D3D29|nr:carbohydrate kinase [Synechococcus sp. CC9902]ABB25119.1 putative fructokinase [Synechococcus sp. CC9902]